ncbi:hypothetical protein [Methylocystis parvus]|uniref:Uncharacterized protein n=1 Tax=Methylocystis parvus TaxID=134 RepID=A0A6B8M573_9HYPH|nr:hypothetical protein [Methylocystis parvus]QGM97485.1 hypothetical protein F7D14_08425 [Methylocystis parvus]WBJ98595.1 hypothetical protein MMG94_11175 [Methylocystis parvus OBBP]
MFLKTSSIFPLTTSIHAANFSCCIVITRQEFRPAPLRPVGAGDDQPELREFRVARVELAVVIGVEDVEQRLHVGGGRRGSFGEDDFVLLVEEPVIIGFDCGSMSFPFDDVAPLGQQNSICFMAKFPDKPPWDVRASFSMRILEGVMYFTD